MLRSGQRARGCIEPVEAALAIEHFVHHEGTGAARNILVNAVAPSIIDTPANRQAMPDADHAAWPKPEAIAEIICHLASPANQVARGAIVPVYGRA